MPVCSPSNFHLLLTRDPKGVVVSFALLSRSGGVTIGPQQGLFLPVSAQQGENGNNAYWRYGSGAGDSLCPSWQCFWKYESADYGELHPMLSYPYLTRREPQTGCHLCLPFKIIEVVRRGKMVLELMK